MKAEGSRVEDHSELHSEFEAHLDYFRSCLKKTKENKQTDKQTNKKIKPYAARAAAGDVALRLVGLEAQDSAPRITKQRNKATRKDAPGPGGSGLKASGYTAFLV